MTTSGSGAVGQVELKTSRATQETVKVRFWTGETLMMKWEDLKLVGAASIHVGRDIAKQKRREARLGLNKDPGIKYYKWVDNHGF